MRKIHFILSALALLVASCSIPSLIPATPTLAAIPISVPTNTLLSPAVVSQPTEAPSVTPAPTDTSEASVSLTQTPLIITTPMTITTGTALTGTSASTARTVQATASLSTNTSTPTATFTATSTATNTSTPMPQPTPQGPVFQSVTVSSNQLNWDNTCETIPVTFTAQTQIGFNVTEVLLFLRLQNQAGTDTTFWNKAITMHSAGLGAFTYDITPDKINHYLDFNTAWIQYQLVAYNAQLHEVGRTQIYENTLTLTRCP